MESRGQNRIGMSPFGRAVLRVVLPLAIVAGAVVVARAAHTFADGETLKAQDLNDRFKAVEDRVSVIEARAGSGFHAMLTKATSIPTGVETAVLFDKVDFDLAKTANTAGEYSPITGAFVPRSGGTYLVHCFMEFSGGVQATASLRLNGVKTVVAHAGGINEVMALAAADTVTCYGYQASGGPLDLYSDAAVERVTFSATRLY